MISATGLIAACAIILAAAGWGTLMAKILRAPIRDGATGYAVLSAVGLVLSAWIGFLLLLFGLTGTVYFATPIVVGLVACFRYRRDLFGNITGALRKNSLISVGFALLLGIDLLSATIPVLDADTNAYHFTLPLQFLSRGELFLVPRALDGATPLLFQTVYAYGLALGGETGALALAKLISWLSVLLVYGIVRDAADRGVAALAAIALLTMPAMIYGMGGGQIEPRLALLVLAGTTVLCWLWQAPAPGYAAIGGIVFGGVAAAKLTGLLLGPAVLLFLLIATRNWKNIATFVAAACVAGGQWYIWLWFQTGSPVFPMFADSPFWSAANQAAFAERIISHERVLPTDLVGLFSYPFHAFFATAPGFESGRTGIGPVLPALVPLAIIGGWQVWVRRHGVVLTSETARLLVLLLGIATITYGFWWFLGVSQRFRHVLPIVCLLIPAAVLLARSVIKTGILRRAFLTLFVAAAAVQIGGWAFYHTKTLRYAVSDQTRNSFLASHLLDHEAIVWIRGNLPKDALLILLERRNNFHLSIPFYRISSDLERLVSVSDTDRDPARFIREIRSLGGTHILFHLLDNPAFSVTKSGEGFGFRLYRDIDGLGKEGSGIGRYHQLVMKLLRDKCARILHRSRTRRARSRVLGISEKWDESVFVTELTPASCPYSQSFDIEPSLRKHTAWSNKLRRAIPFR